MSKVDIEGAVRQFGALSEPDKLVFTFRGHIPWDLEPMRKALVGLAQKQLGWSEEYASRHVRIHPVVSSASANGPITNLQVTYKIAGLYRSFPRMLWRHTSEMECKIYLSGLVQDEYTNFLIQLEDAPHGLKTTMRKPGNKGANKTKGLDRSLVIGSQAAARSGMVYRRADQLPGLEAHVRKDAIKRVVDVARANLDRATGITNDAYASLMVDAMKSSAWRYLLGKLALADFDLENWVSHVTSSPDPDQCTGPMSGEMGAHPLIWRKYTEQDMFAVNDGGQQPLDFGSLAAELADLVGEGAGDIIDIDDEHTVDPVTETVARRTRRKPSAE